MIRVLIADDHAIVREGLQMVLQSDPSITVVASVGSGEDAVLRARELRPDVVVMDLSMPGAGGVAATADITEADGEVAVVVLTTFADRQRVMAALDAGAVGYLMKDATPAALCEAITSAAAGGSPIDPRVARTLIESRRGTGADPPPHRLTAKQTEVVRLVSRGLPNRLVGRELNISEKTVKAHLTQIYTTLGVTDRVQAAMWAREHLQDR